MTVQFRIHGDIAVIQLDYPPLNNLSLELRKALSTCLDDVGSNAAIKAAIIIGSEKVFCAGAGESDAGIMDAHPDIRHLVTQMDSAAKPLIAAIGGSALGGGLELALGCHYRVALTSSKLALPEVTSGLVASNGGIQRLPRIIPVARAAEAILGGTPIPVDEAAQLGLLDEVVEGSLLDGALRFAARLLASGKDTRRIRDMTPRIDDATAFFERKRAELKKSARGRVAPLANLDCLEAAVTKPFDESQDYIKATYMQLAAGTECKALQYSAFAVCEAARIPDVPAHTPIREIGSAAVIGAGTMGGGIAMCFANAGVPVTVIDSKQEAIDRGLATITKNYAATVTRGRLTQNEMDGRLRLISTACDLSAASKADIIVEAVFEDMPVKEQVFRNLDAVAKPGAILATNTSTLDVDQIAAATSRPHDVIGAHFFSPANVMRLLEVIRGGNTAKDVIATTMALGKRIGKVPVLAGVCDGFIGNRILEKYRVQTMLLIDEGASPQQIDNALVSWGLAMGPFAMGDLAGNDVSWLIRKFRAKMGRNYTPNPLADQLCEMGRYGQKTGKGWYRYESGNRKPIPDPEIETMIAEHRRKLGITPRKVTDEEIVEHCVYAMANEGARIVEEGIAIRASDVDVVYVNGYGFPATRGGPMFYADTVGLAKVIATIDGYVGGYRGDNWKPSTWLRKLAGEGGKFSEGRQQQ